MSDTYTEALQKQHDIMLKIAKRLDEKGYAVVVHGLNREAKHERYPYGYLLSSTMRFVNDWATVKNGNNKTRHAREMAKRPVIVNVFPRCVLKQGFTEEGMRAFTFQCAIPRRVRYREIHAALSMHIKSVSRDVYFRGTLLGAQTRSECVQYVGDSKDKLEILLRLLEMPQHRKILLGI